jgi:hypothetical protein
VSNLPMRNCQDTVVNWLLLRNNFVILHVRPVLIGTINPLLCRFTVITEGNFVLTGQWILVLCLKWPLCIGDGY